MDNNHTNQNITQLEGADRVRTRPAAMLGSAGQEGVHHTFTEILGNALDEFNAGYGTKLEVVMYEDGAISVRDYGRGVPMDWNKKQQQYNWHLIFNELYAGGKYEDYQKELKLITDWDSFNPRLFNYLFSIGLNGLGASATQYSSEYMIVKSVSKGVLYEMHFALGKPVTKLMISDTDMVDGTFIKWKPDHRVFTKAEFDVNYIKERCQDYAFVSGIEMHFSQENGESLEWKGYTLDKALKSYFKEDIETRNLKIREVGFKRDSAQPDGKFLILAFGEGVVSFHPELSQSVIKGYVNTIAVKDGSIKHAFESAVESFFKDKLSSKGLKLDLNYVKNVVSGVFSIFTNNTTALKNQTKDYIEDSTVYHGVLSSVSNLLEVEFAKKNEKLLECIDVLIEEAKIREEMKEREEAARKIRKTKTKRAIPVKFTPSFNFNNKKFDNSELWIVEGDSAGGSVKKARDSDYQSVFPIRGKLVNSLKTSILSLVSNPLIVDIFTLLNTGMSIDGNEDLFNIKESRFSKIVISTDADEDGYQIRVLLFAMFYVLAPEIIEQGLLYIAETPRYGVYLNNGDIIYALDDRELAEINSNNVGRVTKVARYKGLGQVNPSVLAETTVTGKGRNLVPVRFDTSDPDVVTLVDTLFGKDETRSRKGLLLDLLGDDTLSHFNEKAELFNQLSEDKSLSDLDDLDVVEVEY